MPSPQEMSAALLGDQDPWVSSPLMGPGGQSMVNALQGAASHLAHIPQQAFEASENLRMGGDYNPAPAVEAAQYLMGGGMPMAEAGAAGIFGGRLAQTANPLKMGTAQIMEMRGVHPTEIWRKTGWTRGVDGQWRFEIPDRQSNYNAVFKKPPNEDGLQFSTIAQTVGQALHHPSLYRAYPDLKDIPLTWGNPEYNGAHWPSAMGPERIELNQYLPQQEAHSTLLHELQHAVQDREGFASGTNIEDQIKPAGDELRRVWETVGTPRKFTDEEMDKLIKTQAFDRYRAHAGEVEARNVQRRMDWTPEERNLMSPAETEDFRRLVQILKKPNKSPYR